VLTVGHVFEYNAAIRAVDELIKSGELGQIYYMSFERTNLGPVRTDVGALWDLASHDASIMCDFMSAAPVSVTAKGQSYLNPGIDDVVFATFNFDGGIAAHVHASWLNPSKVRQVIGMTSWRCNPRAFKSPHTSSRFWCSNSFPQPVQCRLFIFSFEQRSGGATSAKSEWEMRR